MATKTIYLSADMSTMGNGYDSGNTKDNHHPCGLGAGSYTWRPFLKFAMDWTGVVQITSAVLYMKSRANESMHAYTGSSPRMTIAEVTGTFTPVDGGSAENVWSSSASPKRSTEPAVSGTYVVDTGDMTRYFNTWYSWNITTIFNRWAPSTVKQSGGSPGPGDANNGIRLISSNEGSTTKSIEFYSSRGGAAPYIVLTYTTNNPPNAPTSMTPTGGSVQTTLTPTLAFTHSDTDSDPLSTYDLQVSTDSSFTSVTHWDIADQTTGISGNNVSRTYGGTALVRGTTYYWRARTNDGIADGTWSAANSFLVNSLPTVSLTDPASSGIYAHMVYEAGSGWASPRLYFAWSYSDAQSHPQSNFEWEVYNDSAGSPGSSFATGSGTTGSNATVSTTPTRGNKYHIRVRVKDGYEWSDWTGYRKVTAEWGTADFTKDVRIGGSPPTTWEVSSLGTTVGASQAIAIEYNSGSNGTGTGLMATWQSSLASVTKNNYVYYRLWFLSWGSATPGSPSFDNITIHNTGSVIQPDFWSPSPLSGQGASIEMSDRAFGTQSLRMDGDGTENWVTQQVVVEQNQWYILQGRIRSVGNSGAAIYIAATQNAALGSALAATTELTADAAWTQYVTDPWYSGEVSSVWLHCRVDGAAATFALFDGLKMEKGSVASPWTPGAIGQAATVDAGGLMVDGLAGGIFRLRGTTGGARDIVELGTKGLVFGGDANLYSAAADVLKTDDDLTVAGGTLILNSDVRLDRSAAKTLTLDDGAGGALTKIAFGGPLMSRGGTAFPGSPSSGDLFWRTDLKMEFVYDGTRWLSTELFSFGQGVGPTTATAGAVGISATQGGSRFMGVPALRGGSDLWLEQVDTVFLVNGGSALSGSHKWVGVFNKRPTGNTETAILTVTIDSGSSSVWRRDTQTVNALLNNGTTHFLINWNWTKTGTPGDLFWYAELTYRIVAT